MGKGRTSPRVASQASATLRSHASTAIERALAASALAQAGSRSKDTGRMTASEASDVLRDPHSSAADRSTAASVLAQRNK
jgi:hypothetical protein